MIIFEREERHIWRVRSINSTRQSRDLWNLQQKSQPLARHLWDVIMGVGGRLQYHEMGRGRSIEGIGSNLFTVAIPGFGLFTDKLQDLRPSTAESAS